MMKRPVTGVLLLAASFAISLSAQAQEEQEDAADGAWPSRWVTALAPLAEDRVAAATATGLPLRPGAVVAFSADAPASAEILYEHPASVWAIVASEDGNRLASSDYQGNLAVADASRGDEAKVHEGVLERWTRALALSPDGTRVVAGNEAGKLFVWDLDEERVVSDLELEGGQIFDLAFLGEDRLAVANGAGRVHLVGWPELELQRTVQFSSQPIWTVLASGSTLIAAGADQTVRRIGLDALDEEPETEADEAEEAADDEAADDEEEGDEDGESDEEAEDETEDAEESEGEEVGRLDDWVTAGAVLSGGEVAVATARGGVSLLRDPAGGALEAVEEAPSGVWALAASGSRLLAGTRKHQVTVFREGWTVEYAAPDQESDDSQ